MNPDDFQALFQVLGDPETMWHYPYTFDGQHVRDWIERNMNRYVSGNAKVLMGHSDISVTMNTYTHLRLGDAVEEMGRMQEIKNARKKQKKLADRREETKVSKKMFRAG